MKKWFKRVFFSLLGLFLIMQVVPAGRTNPPVDEKKKLSPPPEVEGILRAACYDCHSDETQWPWYAHVAPVSWWIANHVNDGRRRLNLSEWADVAQRQGKKPLLIGGQPATTVQVQCKILGDMETDMEMGRMPLPSYLIMHPDARITPAQFKIVTDWLHATVAQLNVPPTSVKSP